MQTLLQDLRHAVRWLKSSPWFTALAVLCLGLSIGVNTTIFSCVYAGLLKPFDFSRPDRLVVMDRRHHTGREEDLFGMSYQVFRDFERQAGSFSAIAALSDLSVAISDGEEPERYQGTLVTWNLFPMLGVQPMGRSARARPPSTTCRSRRSMARA